MVLEITCDKEGHLPLEGVTSRRPASPPGWRQGWRTDLSHGTAPHPAGQERT